jgi:hypothetical protein
MGTKKKQEIKIPKTVKFLGKRYKLKIYDRVSYFINRDGFQLIIKIDDLYGHVIGDLSLDIYPNEFNASFDANSDSIRSVIDELERSVHEYFENLGKFLGYEIEG